MREDLLLVVAGALIGTDDRILMHRRPFDKHHGGLWEFPGGKVEPGELPVFALIRELAEELGVTLASDDCVPVGFAEETQASGDRPIVILLYKVKHWEGEPSALEGGELEWCDAIRIAELHKPPLDRDLAQRLFPHLP